MDAININMGSGWKAYFYDQLRASMWKLQAPQFKQCKKKKEFYTDAFDGLWYKHPYKYDMVLKGEAIDDNVLAHIKLLYADTLEIVKPLNNKPTITKNENFFHPTHNEREQEVHVGPFQFQVCSYKLDNRDVCLGVYLMLPPDHGNTESKVVSILVSPRFTIRSKKPVQQKNKRKRKMEDCEEEADCEQPPLKKVKMDDFGPELSLVELPLPPSSLPLSTPSSVSFPEVASQQFDSLDFQQMMSFLQTSTHPQPQEPAQPMSFPDFSTPMVPAFHALAATERKARLAEIISQCSGEELEFVRRKVSEAESRMGAALPLPLPAPLVLPMGCPPTPSDIFDMKTAADMINVADYFKEGF